MQMYLYSQRFHFHSMSLKAMRYSLQMQDYKLTTDLFNFENNLSDDAAVAELLREFYRLWEHWDTFLMNYFEIYMLVHLELMIPTKHSF